MSRVTFYLIACLMVLTTVTCVPPELKSRSLKISEQCRARGFQGACGIQNMINGEIGCLNLVCAKASKGLYEAYNTGALTDNTPCGPYKVCKSGVCVQEGVIKSTLLWIEAAGLTASDTYPCVLYGPRKLVSTTRRPTTAKPLCSRNRH